MSTFKFGKAGKPVEKLIVDTIIRHIKPKQIILFGSRARDDAPARSDYDVAIDDDELTPAKLARIRAEMEIVPTLLSIDVIWMNRAAETLRKRIVNEGKILYERQG
ncbi:MAG: nucleotidyltransferase domain-containing protein [candidate division KSB1 bacterium]|nr:nucleotidyltransferase domain-containing protein [candidate division KSB1 bacterium]MDZ7369091.1 nucleotidyltransferase domain-containing protein [candidate division KSB1 bacterium]MDZ7407071.1 nucleotidyltransferase domain-containing protein [candidate division KSB1 bacterium]